MRLGGYFKWQMNLWLNLLIQAIVFCPLIRFSLLYINNFNIICYSQIEGVREVLWTYSLGDEHLSCQQQYDEKNIRRRVYDALNVLMAMDIISKDKKEIQWKGLPRTSLNDIEELKTERLGLRNRIEKKAAYLQELEDQFVGLQNLIQRNEQLYSSGNPPSGGVSLPFILVQTRPHATVEVEISEDMQLVHFDFNSTPFELHDDNYVLKAMKFCERPQSDNMTHNPTGGGEGSSMSGLYQPQVPPSGSNVSVRPPTSPPLPGILKARVKQEH
ncbi:Winged helix-like DNA-binding domain superfamily [Sesbania bispinosa]|nr:Winged helix-like DNA-binding domain superfamily [Sesbania bispinosa]